MSSSDDEPHEPYCEDSGTKQKVPYMIVSKEGTKLSQFKAFIKTLPDFGRGLLTEVDWRNCQSYLTSLTYKRAKEISNQTLVDYIILAGEIDKEDAVSSDEEAYKQNFEGHPCCEPSNCEEPVEYMITTKEGTDLDTFKRLIETLPDREGSYEMVSEDMDDQTYVTTLTYGEAMEIAKKPFIDYLVLAGAVEEADFMIHGAVPGQPDLRRKLTSEQHLGILSSLAQRAGGREWPEYVFDPVLGKDQTVYIIDGGFDLGHTDFQGNRKGDAYVVPNYLTLADVRDKRWWPREQELLHDVIGHGTIVASLAVGQEHGVAPNANFVLVKFVQFYHSPHSKQREYAQPRRAAVKHAWQWVVKDVAKRRRHGDPGKFIVNMSCGTSIIYGPLQGAGVANKSEGFRYRPAPGAFYVNYMNHVLRRILKKCWKNDIITVVPAGNSGKVHKLSMDKTAPQNLGREDNALITVGGVDLRGVYWPGTAFDVGKGGSITIYAMAEGVIGVGANSIGDPWATKIGIGTSFASPMVAGLAAYFALLLSLRGEWRTGHVAMDMKRYIAKHAFERRNRAVPKRLPWTYFVHPFPRWNPIAVAYNRAPDGLCSARTPARDDPPPPLSPYPTHSGSMNRGGHQGHGALAHRSRGRRNSRPSRSRGGRRR